MNRSTDDLDDVTLPQRPRRPEPRADLRSDARASAREDLRDDMAPQDREFTLSTGTVLALFFGLALVCAVFFGFGYSMGRKSATAAAPVADTSTGSDTTEASTADAAASNKPSAGSPAIQAIPGYLSQKQADTANRNPATQTTRTAPASNATSVTLPLDNTAGMKPKKPTVDPDSQIVETPKPTVTHSATLATANPVPTTTGAPVQTMNAGIPVAASGTTYVQIAAVSHKEDADVLLSALKRRGYSVFTRAGDADKLIHVQVGPFASKKDAEVMRQKLLGDGYNAILK
ncbi:SPOR domain-containing protein [Terriglobus sp.]|uniref:SPOR domain-containing protein n=1 Tax=Terriglobus sp. TaxID=1889013 RepID=UPI003B0014FA